MSDSAVDPVDQPELYIGGQRVHAAGRRRIEVVNPSTAERIGSVPEAGPADIDAAVGAARAALSDWSERSSGERAEVLVSFADALDERAEELARAVSVQNGMPIFLSRLVEAVTPSAFLRYYAGLASEHVFEERRPAVRGGSTIVRRVAAGVVGAIVPWNYPETLAFSKIAPALAAGCTVVWKPSPETVLDAYVVAEAAEQSKLPDGLLSIVPGAAATGRSLVEHPGLDRIAFTGSSTTGRVIGEVAGRLLRPVHLELGGKSAAIVLDDVDLGAHLGEFFAACLANNGQTCYLSTRVLVPAARANELTEALAAFVSGLTVGDALEESTQVGPLVAERQRVRVEQLLAQAAGDGARTVVGGHRLDRPGYFVAPTLLDGVENSWTIAQEEIFGPVLTVSTYRDVDEAIALANASRYGLGGSVWTEDIERGIAVARAIETGTIGVNGYAPDPLSPFGGVKESGFGRENGPEAFEEYLVTKSIYLPA